MAQCEHLLIYKDAYTLLKSLTEATNKFSKSYKYTLGESLRKEAIDISTLIFRTNSTQDLELRQKYLLQILEKTKVLKLLLRLAKDMNLIATPLFAINIKNLDSISVQSTNWRKYCLQETESLSQNNLI